MKRPTLKIEVSKKYKTIEILAVVILAVVTIYSLLNYKLLPQIVPTHFGFDGSPNSFGDKKIFLSLILISVILVCSTLTLSRFPHIFNYPVKITENNYISLYTLASGFMIVLSLELSLIFSIIQFYVINFSLGKLVLFLPLLLSLSIFCLLFTVIYFIYKSIKLKD